MRLWLQQRNYQFTTGKCRSTADLQSSYIEQAGAAPPVFILPNVSLVLVHFIQLQRFNRQVAIGM